MFKVKVANRKVPLRPEDIGLGKRYLGSTRTTTKLQRGDRRLVLRFAFFPEDVVVVHNRLHLTTSSEQFHSAMTGLSRRVEELLPGITLTIPEGLSCIEDTPSRREKIPQKGKLCGVLVEPEVVVEGTFGEIRYVLVDYRV